MIASEVGRIASGSARPGPPPPAAPAHPGDATTAARCGERVAQRGPPADRDPGALGREALDVLLLALEQALRDEEREVGVDVAGLLDAPVHVALHVLPDAVAVGLDDHAALDRAVVGEVGLEHDVQVPLRVILGLRGDLLGDAVFHVSFSYAAPVPGTAC